MSFDAGRRPDAGPAPAPPARAPGVLVGRLVGIPVFMSPSWLIPAAFITLLYADVFAGVSWAPAAYFLSFGVAVLVALSVFLHEASHSLTARALGLPVRRIVIHLLGGVSEVEREPETPTREYLVAAAGPLASLLLAGLGFAVLPLASGHVARYAVVFALINGMVGVVNLLPGLPLDGGRVLHSVLWRALGDRHRAQVGAAVAGRVVAIGIILVPIVRQAAASDTATATGMNVDVLWAVLIASYVWGGATVELRAAEIRRRLPSIRLRDLARRAFPVAADLPLAEALRRAKEAGARALVTVDSRGHPHGLVSEQAVLATPAERQPWILVADLARPIENGLILPVAAEGAAVLEAMRARPASEYVVVEDTGDVVGVLATADVAAVLADRRRPGGRPAVLGPLPRPPAPRPGSRR